MYNAWLIFVSKFGIITPHGYESIGMPKIKIIAMRPKKNRKILHKKMYKAALLIFMLLCSKIIAAINKKQDKNNSHVLLATQPIPAPVIDPTNSETATN